MTKEHPTLIFKIFVRTQPGADKSDLESANLIHTIYGNPAYGCVRMKTSSNPVIASKIQWGSSRNPNLKTNVPYIGS